MKRILTILSALSLVVASGAMAEDYGWSLSASNTDPFDHTSPLPTGGQTQVYLWLVCNTNDGGSALEAEITGSLAGFFAGYVPIAPSNNFGVGTTLQLGLGCINSTLLVGGLNCFVFAQGTMCLGPSAGNNLNVTVNCQPQPANFPNAVLGYDGTGGTPCTVGDCTTTSIDSGSWGSIKSLYR